MIRNMFSAIAHFHYMDQYRLSLKKSKEVKKRKEEGEREKRREQGGGLIDVSQQDRE
jgi:hypothetical protein